MYPHFDITVAANKNNFGTFTKETFLDVIKHVHAEIESYVHDTTKLKMIQYINKILKIKVTTFKALKENVI